MFFSAVRDWRVALVPQRDQSHVECMNFEQMRTT
jgi:hypothetical protein